MIHCVQTQIHLFDVATQSSNGNFESIFGYHLLFDTFETFTDLLDATGDEANHILVRFFQ